MTRILASIQIIKNKEEIQNADLIELVTILGWQCVVKKGEFSSGDLCIYFEIDSLLPKQEHFEFLRKNCWNESLQKYRLKTIRLRGVLSQGLVLPISILEHYRENPVIEHMMDTNTYPEGFDLTSYLEIDRFDPPLSVATGNQQQYIWPISKTDETRVQSVPKYIDDIKKNPYIITVKLDGTSSSFILDKKHDEIIYAVCSRNLCVEEGDNIYWNIERELNIRQKLIDHYNETGELLGIQGEICGPKIQKNPLGLKKPDLFVFNIVNVHCNNKLPFSAVVDLAGKWGIRTVPILEQGDCFDYSASQLLMMAEGHYKQHFESADSKTEREGIVIRSQDQRISFKAISNKYLIKNE